jgi:hypothetical protein
MWCVQNPLRFIELNDEEFLLGNLQLRMAKSIYSSGEGHFFYFFILIKQVNSTMRRPCFWVRLLMAQWSSSSDTAGIHGTYLKRSSGSVLCTGVDCPLCFWVRTVSMLFFPKQTTIDMFVHSFLECVSDFFFRCYHDLKHPVRSRLRNYLLTGDGASEEDRLADIRFVVEKVTRFVWFFFLLKEIPVKRLIKIKNSTQVFMEQLISKL